MEIPTGKKVKMAARKNATPYVVYSDEEQDGYEKFINSDASRRFMEYFSKMGFHSERGFMFDNQEENLGLAGDLGTTIKKLGWMKLCHQPGSYNISLMKEFYSNLTDPGRKRIEVVVRGTKVVYNEATLNLALNIKESADEYQELLLKLDEADYDVIMESLCNPGTKWVESSFVAIGMFSFG